VVAHPPLLDDHLIATHVDPPGDGKHKTNWGFIVKHIWNRIKYYIYYIYGIIIAIYIGDYYCETLIYIYHMGIVILRPNISLYIGPRKNIMGISL
jgi:hypothetical protein